MLGARAEVLLFTCVFRPGAGGEADEHPGFAPCGISLQDERGTLLELTSTTSVETVERALGPLTRTESAEGHVASTVIGSVRVSFNFDHAGRLALLDLEPAEDGTGASG